MNKVLGLFLPFLIALSASASESRVFQKTNSNSASVKIETESKEGTQAAVYVDGEENAQFINMLLDDPSSRLSVLRGQIEQEHCQTNSATPDGWIEGCGGVEVTEVVRTAFGRGGWMQGGATYTFFVGFRTAGTGHIFESSYMVNFSEEVDADVDQDMKYLGSVTKKLVLGKIVRLPAH
ncbi:hypothetical protein [Bdellovibrio sp. HCB-110]|uniref:hypothetical protein n=1 Tax=Bdellovibrio sp. HCB-110 TaxID=3391182 RepID=UPI0039B3E774